MLEEAYRDLKYLLNRGYRKSVALKFVANHYRLTKTERHLLARCVFSDEWIEEVGKKLLSPEEVRDRVLAIDGFNVLITLESLLEGKAILCEDNLVRDLEYKGRYRTHDETEDNVRLIISTLAELSPSRVIFFYGKNNPGSGSLRAITLRAIEDFGLSGEVCLVKSPDFELKAFEVVATADTGIIVKVPHVLDLARLTGEGVNATPISLWKAFKLRA
ncbi:DUF434 domain-containing protein [Thermococcus sp.]